jgi:hypothetical protein
MNAEQSAFGQSDTVKLSDEDAVVALLENSVIREYYGFWLASQQTSV